jgi:hypothetical protein
MRIPAPLAPVPFRPLHLYQSATPPCPEHAPECWAAFEYVPSLHFAVASGGASDGFGLIAFAADDAALPVAFAGLVCAINSSQRRSPCCAALNRSQGMGSAIVVTRVWANIAFPVHNRRTSILG